MGREAARWFVERLRAGPAARQVARVVLFGSVARGAATPESDVDVLVVATGDLASVSEACADASLDTWIRWRRGVEPVIYCEDEVRHAASPFVRSAIERGEEVMAMEESRLLLARAADHLALAGEYLDSARRIRAAGEVRVAADAAYNAAELAAKGLILAAGAELPGSHSGVVNRFGELYVVTGKALADLGRRLHRTLQLRNRARYDVHARVGADDADEALGLAEAMVALARTTTEAGGGP